MPHALLIVPDAMGDQVLRRPLYDLMLRSGWRVTLVARRGAFEILERAAPGAALIELPVPPDAAAEAGSAEGLDFLLREVAAAAPDLLVGVLKNPTWVEAAVFERHSACRRIALSVSGPVDTRRKAELDARRRRLDAAADTRVAVPEDSHDSTALAAMAVALGLIGDVSEFPRPALSRESLPDVASLLAGYGLKPGGYVFSSPAGFLNVAIKALPPAMVRGFIRHLKERHGLKVLLAGVEAESAWLREAATGTESPVWIGGPGSLDLCMALLANARCYAGADTGTMHLAAALDVPVFAIFGGGAWGRFLPLARRRAVVTALLPCAGCDWVCLYPEARCIVSVTPESVATAIDRLLEDVRAPGDFIDTGEVTPPVPARCFKDLIAMFENAESDRAARLQVIHDRERDVASRDAELHIARDALAAARFAGDEALAAARRSEGECSVLAERLRDAEAESRQLRDEVTMLNRRGPLRRLWDRL